MRRPFWFHGQLIVCNKVRLRSVFATVLTHYVLTCSSSCNLYILHAKSFYIFLNCFLQLFQKNDVSHKEYVTLHFPLTRFCRWIRISEYSYAQAIDFTVYYRCPWAYLGKVWTFSVKENISIYLMLNDEILSSISEI